MLAIPRFRSFGYLILLTCSTAYLTSLPKCLIIAINLSMFKSKLLSFIPIDFPIYVSGSILPKAQAKILELFLTFASSNLFFQDNLFFLYHQNISRILPCLTFSAVTTLVQTTTIISPWIA